MKYKGIYAYEVNPARVLLLRRMHKKKVRWQSIQSLEWFDEPATALLELAWRKA